MMPVGERLSRIVDLIELTISDLIGKMVNDFEADRIMVDATAYRVMHIGEHAMRLGADVHGRHTSLPWRNMASMRNLIAHQYDAVDPAILWRTAHEHLGNLKSACLLELAAEQADGE